MPGTHKTDSCRLISKKILGISYDYPFFVQPTIRISFNCQIIMARLICFAMLLVLVWIGLDISSDFYHSLAVGNPEI